MSPAFPLKFTLTWYQLESQNCCQADFQVDCTLLKSDQIRLNQVTVENSQAVMNEQEFVCGESGETEVFSTAVAWTPVRDLGCECSA